MSRQIKIFDTTLRDGEQCPGASLNVEEKVEIAKQLAKLGVDIIEGGFAFASPGDFEAITRIAKEVKGPTICSLARAKKGDIERAYEAVKHAEKPRIHTFIATSPIHMEHKLKMSPRDVLEATREMVAYAKQLCFDVEFSAEDATRSELEFLLKVFDAAIEAGATTINIPDTVGYAIPEKFGDLVKTVIESLPAIRKNGVDVSVHCHNDLGLSVANSLVAIRAGATQVECTINGIGERAGNASLEEIVMTLKTRKDVFDVETRIHSKEIYKVSRLVSNLTGMIVQPNKAVVGANAFAHESGIHQHGILQYKLTYEIMKPEDIGLTESRLVLGKHSGRHAFVEKLSELGYALSREDIEKTFTRFKEIADKKKEVSAIDLEYIVAEEVYHIPEAFRLESVEIHSGTKSTPKATIAIRQDSKVVAVTAEGVGPVDAAYKAVRSLTGSHAQLVDYTIQAITGGTDALGEVTVRLREGEHIYTGHGADPDILVASVKAYLAAINKQIYGKTKGKEAPSLARETP